MCKSDTLTECQVKEKSPTVVKEETTRVPAINALDVKLESDCVRIELAVNITKVIITKNDQELQLSL